MPLAHWLPRQSPGGRQRQGWPAVELGLPLHHDRRLQAFVLDATITESVYQKKTCSQVCLVT